MVARDQSRPGAAQSPLAAPTAASIVHGRAGPWAPRRVAGVAASIALLAALVPSGPVEPAAMAATAPGGITHEYDLKAVFLFHFAEFVDWPTSAFRTAGAPMTIGILGEDPFGGALDQIVANETSKGRRLIVRHYEQPHQVDSCQILFISRSEQVRMGRILDQLARPGLLTVGDAKDFAKQRGIIGFVTARDRVRLQINLAAAKAAGLTISSKLLRQAEIVKSKAHP